MRILSIALLVSLLLARSAVALPPSEVIEPGSRQPEIVSGLALAQPDLLELVPSTSTSPLALAPRWAAS